jgi:SPP1 gp7 family putative phage head morphogenesis protein
MPSQEYWTERAEESARRMYDKADNTYGQLKAVYKQASDDMTKELNAFYTKYGLNQQSPVFETLADGTEVIKSTTVKRVVPIYEARKYKRLNSLEKQLNVIMSDMAKGQNAYMTTNLRLLAQESYNRYFFDVFQGYGVGYQFDLLDPKLVTQLIRNPVNGQDFSTRIWKNKDLLANQLQQELNNGLIQGVSSQEMTKRFKQKVSPFYAPSKNGVRVPPKPGAAYKAAERLMRTEITNTYNQATLAGYNASGIVDDYEYLATLDNRTSTICQDLDGKVFKISEATAGLNYPPMHPNCRSTTVAKFDDEEFERIARNPITGETYRVPSTMKYSEWAETVGL